MSEYILRLFDFNVYQQSKSLEQNSDSDGSEPKQREFKDNNLFMIQMFGVDTQGKTYSVIVEGFRPFFYVMVEDSWKVSNKEAFLVHLKNKMGKYYENSISECKLIKRRKLYGFDGEKQHKFIYLEFMNTGAFNKAKNLWYSEYDTENGGYKLLKNGYKFKDTFIKIYESNIPPLLRFFHITDISPSGWVCIPKDTNLEDDDDDHNSNNSVCNSDGKNDGKNEDESESLNESSINCNYTIRVDYRDIMPLNNNEERVPYKIMSFDIEASSSHGDFPVPIKSYKKLATNIIEYFENLSIELTKEFCKRLLKQILSNAFGFDTDLSTIISLVYPKNPIKTQEKLMELCEKWLDTKLQNLSKDDSLNSIENYYEKMNHSQHLEEDEEDIYGNSGYIKSYDNKTATIVDVLMDKKFEREGKLKELNKSLDSIFPKLEGDKVTFIGSTFMYYGQQGPHLNHCIVLNSCAPVAIENTQIESYNTEREVLLAWQQLVQRENPDIVIGYNIFGFDYEFMFRRAQENNCIEEFLQLSRNKEEVCGTYDTKIGEWKIEESSIQIASGQHDLRFIKMNGRLQIDLYNFYRREANLTSYKLDYVAGNFIGDFISNISYFIEENETINMSIIKTKNMTGLLVGSYIHFEEIGYSVDYYENGAKFMVIEIDNDAGIFTVAGIVKPDFEKKVRWCLAKDDVSPKDIFRLTNGSAEDRSIIAKYCLQDCNLVHYLFNKSDILTGFIEMAKICSVPINFLVMRGQGIKLTSFVSKKCREKGVLMPVIEKGGMDEGYEGAIVLDPKCDLYLDNPVACVDYASLYPSSMISENLSHDTKVWTMEYDLAGNLVEEWGEKDHIGNFIYDNLPGYEYVNITYDTYKYIRKNPKAAAEKIKCGYKTCRFVQPLIENAGIMPSILKELLKARKDTRKLIPQQADEFMKNVLDQRQLGYKVTANSLYGQCGAKTSTFYEKDIAACTTATGRTLLTYAKRLIEEVYGNKICQTTNHGPVLTKAEYIYGDSVANYTPIYIKKNDCIYILSIDKIADIYGNGLWITCSEPGKQEKEFCELDASIETWSDKGWTRLYRVIRHKLSSHKKMFRILTGSSLVDVTDDHSLLSSNGQEISPNDCNPGMELLHHSLPYNKNFVLIDEITHLMSCDDFNNIENFSSSLKDHVYLAQIACLLKNPRIFLDNDQQIVLENINEKIDVNYFTTKTSDYYNCENYENYKHVIQDIIEIPYEGYVYDLTTENHHFAAGIGSLIVHNTDSVFFTFNLQTPTGVPIRGKDALEITIEIAQEAGHLASHFLKGPHDLEYEKTFMPFCLLSKKRYVGMLYETDPNKGKRKEMGIVLKRRDNAPIVKDIYGGIIDILMKEQSIPEAIQFLKSCLQNIVEEKYPIEKLIITKSLRSGYKNPKAIAHKVLADRITARDPGNKPSSGDRIPFVYISPQKTTNSKEKLLQGNKIETPSFIRENNLNIDYSFYITNQIMKPIQQVFALVLEKIWKLQNKLPSLKKYKKDVLLIKEQYKEKESSKIDEKIEDLRCKEIKTLLFDEYLRETNNTKTGMQSLTQFFNKK